MDTFKRLDWQGQQLAHVSEVHTSPSGRISLQLGGLLYGEEAVAFLADQQSSMTYLRYSDGSKISQLDFDWLLHTEGGVCSCMESYYLAQFVQTSKLTLD